MGGERTNATTEKPKIWAATKTLVRKWRKNLDWNGEREEPQRENFEVKKADPSLTEPPPKVRFICLNLLNAMDFCMYSESRECERLRDDEGLGVWMILRVREMDRRWEMMRKQEWVFVKKTNGFCVFSRISVLVFFYLFLRNSIKNLIKIHLSFGFSWH